MYISNAVKTLLNIKIKQLFDDIDFRWQEFRDEDLWSRPCELVYTLNHKALKELYETYSRTNRGKNKKPFDADFMIFEDCELMFTKDCRLKIPIRTIRQAHALSKMTVINEIDKNSELQYLKLEYVEFLEFIARLGDIHFQGSELENLDLHEKIEHILDEILPIIGAQRKKQRITIDEFSQSDDDY